MTLLLRLAFWIALFFAFTMAVIPQPPQVLGNPSDKLLHVFAFLVLTGLAAAAYPRLSLIRIGLALAAFGIAIELIQLIPALNRDGDLIDWLADSLAIVFALLIIWAVRRMRCKKLTAVKRPRRSGEGVEAA